MSTYTLELKAECVSTITEFWSRPRCRTRSLAVLAGLLLDWNEFHLVTDAQVFRAMGNGVAEEVKALSPPLDLWRSFVYCESLAGDVFGTVDHFEARHLSPPDSVWRPPWHQMAHAGILIMLENQMRS